MTQTSVLEVNGRRYNAVTGDLLHTGFRSVDGFLPSKPVAADNAPSVLVTHSTDAHRSGSHHTHRHPVQHSQTLMRHAVHHPKDGLKRHLKPVSHTGALVKGVSFDIVPKHAAQSVDADRLRRAGHINRSDYVRRFAAAPVTLRTAQARPLAQNGAPYAQPIEQPTRPATALHHEPSTDVFERALAAANSHKQPYVAVKHKTSKLRIVRRVTGVMASVAAIVLIVGFVAYQNSATIQLRLASSRAGITATLPAWQPSGFHLGTFSYGAGNVSISYKNAVSGQQYTIAQAASNWDSSALLSEYVYPNNESYDTITSAGTTIYTYGQNNATWVSGGIWYKLTSDGSLTTSQIVNIATSMQS